MSASRWGRHATASARAGLVTIFVYSTMAAAYLCGNTISHPETMVLPLTHFWVWPSERQALDVSAVMAVASFFALRLEVHLDSARTRDRPSS